MESVWKSLPKPIICLAPMEDVTDTVFRQVLVELGKPVLMFSEFTNVHQIFSHSSDYRRLEFTQVEKPLILQIWGLEPGFYYLATKLALDLGYDGVDINMGCPQKKIIKKGACSALINNPELASEIIKATQEGAEGKIPVSVKTRIGFDQVITEKWISLLLEHQLDALTIHGRTSKQMSLVPADWGEIKKSVDLKNQISPETVLIGNGDVLNMNQANQLVADTGVDGIMIGRGIFHNPWLFANQDSSHKTIQERLAALRLHIQIWEATWQGKAHYEKLKRFFKIYIQEFENAADLRQRLMETENPRDAYLVLDSM